MTRNELTELMLGREIAIRFISMAEAVRLHDQAIATRGGKSGIRDLALLEKALHEPMHACLGEDAPDLFALATVLSEAIAASHAFEEETAWTGYLCGIHFLVEKNAALLDHDGKSRVFEWMRAKCPDSSGGRPGLSIVLDIFDS